MIEQSKSDSCVLLANIEPISIPASFLKFCPVAFQPVGLPLDATDLRRVESCARSPEKGKSNTQHADPTAAALTNIGNCCECRPFKAGNQLYTWTATQ
jgi:hypothetical protein